MIKTYNNYFCSVPTYILMESIRDTASRITTAVNEQTNLYDAIDAVMEMLSPEVKPEIRHYKGNSYEVISEGKMKNPECGAWQKCVNYKSLKDGELYTRDKKDFEKKFTLSETKS